ncbi:hypothetical protein BDB01DRAFT_796328 [Pilobolus umbonatus]|nr:hypothetical protein BDB01DRAFT_796328 [Pilobolus umbonatus]
MVTTMTSRDCISFKYCDSLTSYREPPPLFIFFPFLIYTYLVFVRMSQPRIPSWLPLSYTLALHVNNDQLHTRYLSPNERKYFEDALSSFATWVGFINLSRSEEIWTELENTVFRVRSLLYEYLIPHLFQTNTLCCIKLDLQPLLDQARTYGAVTETDIQHAWHDYIVSHTPVKIETPNAADITEDGRIKEKTAEEQGQNDDVPLRDIFHTLELDRTAMIEQRKLEEFEAQEELNDTEEQKRSVDKSLSLFNADSNFNLKYLLKGILANREKTSLSDRELQHLLSDFKPHRSKWANDDRMGQEELYEACEKVLIELKNYTEHSTPFLNKVNKREAPDYFEVIKKPMDLGTVTKKLKNLNYRSKKEFADDLYLIYDNCLAYNTNSASAYRKHAIAMRRKTDRLLGRVPNISIKERMDNEIEEEGDELSEEEENHRVSKKSSGKHTVTVERKTTPLDYKRERSLTRGSSAAPFSDMEGMTPEDTPDTSYGGKSIKKEEEDEHIDLEQEANQLGAEIDADMGEYQDQIWRHKTKKTRAKLTTDVEKQYQFSFGEREALCRSELDMERFAMMEHFHDKPEVVIKLIRCDKDRFAKWTDHRPMHTSLFDDFDLDSSDDENLDAFFSRKIAKPDKQVDDSVKTDLFMPEYIMTSGIPEIPGVKESIIERTSSYNSAVRKSSADMNPETVSAIKGHIDVPMDVYPELKFPTYGLTPIIDNHNQKLDEIRSIYAKCNAIRNNIPVSALNTSITEKPTPSVIYPSTPIPPLTLDNESGHQMLQRILSKLLTHAGFEGAKMNALNILTDITTEYITNIGKTMRSYWDDYENKMTGDEMVVHSLYENGIMNLNELDNYVHDDIERGVGRLDDIHRRLQTTYHDLLTGVGESGPEEEVILEDEESYITGVFGEELGEDYLGFKALGLDKEYNINSFHIPNRLWFGKNKEMLPSSKDHSKDIHLKYPPPPSFIPIRSDNGIIGLLRPYFSRRLIDSDQPLIEDEYIPNKNKNKSRYPPTNKGNLGKKKTSKESLGSGSTNENKKAKRKRPMEEIVAEKEERAEKKRLKLEEKAQRLAEKEQKRKLREELKEQEKQARIEAKEKKKVREE